MFDIFSCKIFIVIEEYDIYFVSLFNIYKFLNTVWN